MTGKEPKTVTIRAAGNDGEGQDVTVSPGQSPREALADVMGKESDQMLLRKGEDGYLTQGGDMFAEVQDGDKLTAASNPTVG